jgi:hypothetical protein
MNRHVSLRLEMGARALEFSTAHPLDSPGYATALKELQELLALGNQLAEEQERGTTEFRAATARRRELKRSLRRSQLIHLARAAERASREVPGLAEKFSLPRIPIRNLAFRTVVRTMVDEADQQKELLVKHGLVEDVLQAARKSLDEFDGLVERASEGRRVHIGAAANLFAVAGQLVEIVRMLDGLNRYRFASQPDLLAAWTAASNIVGPSVGQAGGRTGGQTGSPPAPPAAEIKPAA